MPTVRASCRRIVASVYSLLDSERIALLRRHRDAKAALAQAPARAEHPQLRCDRRWLRARREHERRGATSAPAGGRCDARAARDVRNCLRARVLRRGVIVIEHEVRVCGSRAGREDARHEREGAAAGVRADAEARRRVARCCWDERSEHSRRRAGATVHKALTRLRRYVRRKIVLRDDVTRRDEQN